MLSDKSSSIGQLSEVPTGITWTDPVLGKALLEHTSPFAFLLLLIMLLRSLTRFIEVCKDD